MSEDSNVLTSHIKLMIPRPANASMRCKRCPRHDITGGKAKSSLEIIHGFLFRSIASNQ
jgi:hypothetical protein